MMNSKKLSLKKLIKLTSLFLLATATLTSGAASKVEKDWTFLIFLNGNNSLDSFGAGDINEMEAVGSTDNVNIVVQWASMSKTSVKRLLVQKDTDFNVVTSPILEEMGAVDMGDWRKLVEFVAWGKANYPAKHYFIDIWNHGSGWHKKKSNGAIVIKDISSDDKTGNVITTEELGQAMSESAQILGQKVDIYGSDACLMAMAEVAGEMTNSVKIFVGSQELEPGDGWDYRAFMQGWKDLGSEATPAAVAKVLTKTYLESYQAGSQGNADVTLSAYDLEKTESLNSAIQSFGKAFIESQATSVVLFKRALSSSQKFYYTDYVDLGDFVKNFSAIAPGFDSKITNDLKLAINDFVISNEVSEDYRNAQGLSVWIPNSSYGFEGRKARYAGLNFARQSDWLNVLDIALKP